MRERINSAAQAGEISFDRSFFGAPGELVRLSPLVRRMTAGNAGPTILVTHTHKIVPRRAGVKSRDGGENRRLRAA
jgi:hypothetical protein